MSYDVRDEALAQLGLTVAQASIDKALLSARLTRAKEIVDGVISSVEWQTTDDGAMLAVLPNDAVARLQGVVTSL